MCSSAAAEYRGVGLYVYLEQFAAWVMGMQLPTFERTYLLLFADAIVTDSFSLTMPVIVGLWQKSQVEEECRKRKAAGSTAVWTCNTCS